MGTCPGSMCHSARLAQRNLPAGEKKTTKGLSNKKVLRMRVKIFRKFKFLKFRLTGKYFSEIQKDGRFDEKERKNRTTTNIVKNSRTRKREKRSLLSWQLRTIRSLVKEDCGKGGFGGGKQYPPVPQIGRDNNVNLRRTRERRLGPPETAIC